MTAHTEPRVDHHARMLNQYVNALTRHGYTALDIAYRVAVVGTADCSRWERLRIAWKVATS